MHKSIIVGLDKPYMRKLRIAMNPKFDREKRARAAAGIRRGIAPMLEVAKLETEVSSICAGKISPTDRFYMKKRIAQIVKQETAVKAGNSVPDMCEGATIGGIYGT
jgi:hypothetical protein